MELPHIPETPLQKAEAVIALQDTLINTLLDEVKTLRAHLESYVTERVNA